MANSLLAIGSWGNFSFGYAGDANPTPYHMDAAPARSFEITFPSTDWTTPAKQGTLAIGAMLERRVLPNGTWEGFGAFGSFSGPDDAPNLPGKGGTVNIVSMVVSWDGRAQEVRGKTHIGPVSFAYGVSVT